MSQGLLVRVSEWLRLLQLFQFITSKAKDDMGYIYDAWGSDMMGHDYQELSRSLSLTCKKLDTSSYTDSNRNLKIKIELKCCLLKIIIFVIIICNLV